MNRRLILALVLGVAIAAPAAQPLDFARGALSAAEGQQTAAPAQDADILARIRKEGMDNSQIMRTMHYLTDVYGPRLTGSPNFKAAAEWTVKEMTRWGFTNGHLEPWEFGRPGWLNEKASGHIISPVKDNLVFEVLAWTPSTKGTVTGQAINIVAPQGPIVEAPPAVAGAPAAGAGRAAGDATAAIAAAQAQLAAAAAGRGGGQGGPQRLGPTEDEVKAYLAGLAPKMKGAIVLVGAPTVVAFQENPPAKRRDDAQ